RSLTSGKDKCSKAGFYQFSAASSSISPISPIRLTSPPPSSRDRPFTSSPHRVIAPSPHLSSPRPSSPRLSPSPLLPFSPSPTLPPFACPPACVIHRVPSVAHPESGGKQCQSTALYLRPGAQ